MSKVDFKVGDKIKLLVNVGPLRSDGHKYGVERGDSLTCVDKNEPLEGYHLGNGQVSVKWANDYKDYFEEKEMFNIKTNPWYISINNQLEFNAVQEWLKENFGSQLSVGYHPNIHYLTNAAYACDEVSQRVMYGNGNPVEQTARHEIKLSYTTKTSVKSVEFPELKSEQQKQLDIVLEKIAELQTQANELKKLL